MNQAAESPLMITPEEARAEFFGNKVGRNKFNELLRNGSIPSVKLGDRYYLNRKKLTEMLERDQVKVE